MSRSAPTAVTDLGATAEAMAAPRCGAAALAARLWSRRRVRLCGVVLGLLGLLVVADLVAEAAGWRAPTGGQWQVARFAFVLVAALTCEFVDSALGMGYGTTLAPLLLLAGFEPLQVVPAILLSECLTGMLAGVMHHKDGNVDFLRDRQARRTTLRLGLLSVAGAIVAALVAVRLTTAWLTTLIGFIILGVGIVVLATARRQLKFRSTHIVLVGAVAAFNKALSGGGYGPLVTGGQVVSGVSPKSAVAITSLAEGLTCLVGLIAYLALGKSFDWGLTVPLVGGALLSVPLATLTLRKMDTRFIRIIVGLTTTVLGAATLLGIRA
jgi:hypothetical protein